MEQTVNPARYIKRPVILSKLANPFLNAIGEEILDPKPHDDILASPIPLPISEQVNNLKRISRVSRLAFLDELDDDDFADGLDDELDDEIGMTPHELEALAERVHERITKKASKKPAEANGGDSLAAPTGDASEGTL